jgi:hypothetical protein
LPSLALRERVSVKSKAKLSSTATLFFMKLPP